MSSSYFYDLHPISVVFSLLPLSTTVIHRVVQTNAAKKRDPEKKKKGRGSAHHDIFKLAYAT